MSDASILSVKDLSIGIPASGRMLLSSVSFDIAADQVVGIIGESGSGKTTLARGLVNWIKPPLAITGGQLIYRGKDLVQLPEAEIRKLRGRQIAYVGSDPGSALDPTLPVGRQLVEKLVSVEPGVSRARAKERVLALLDAVRMPSHRTRFDDFPFQFSGGMMQRVLIVDALVTNPDFLVADNITQPLDVTVSAQILRILKELQRDFQTAIVFVSSSLGVVNEIADQVLVLAHGQIVEQQETRGILHFPTHDYTKRLIAETPRIWDKTAQPAARIKEERGAAVMVVNDVAQTYATRDHSRLFGKKEVQAVRGVSFEVFRGENLGIIGESGCGKSTLSRLLSRLEQPTGGEILFKGKDIAHLSRRELFSMRKGFQLLLQDPFNAIPPHLTIGRTIAEPLYIHGGLSRKEVGEKVRATMAEVGLAQDLYDELPVGLSAGQRQRVNIARAMVLDPELVILDETLSALDQIEQGKLLGLFERLQVRHGITYIYISHDLSMVRRVCNRIAVMYLGRIVELASNDTIFFDPGHPYTRALLSAMPAIEERPYKTDSYLLEGEPPDPIGILAGCSFRSRCPFAFQRCERDDPMLTARSAENLTACHMVEAGHEFPPVRFAST